VINGESWGVYVSQEQVNKDFMQHWFGSSSGARWKAPGSPGGRATLAYLGDDPETYRKTYEIKSKDDPKSWAALIRLCKVLNETPAEELEKALAPLLDVDGVLKFLALENTLINNDGYWVRTSDYNICLDSNGRFHILPHDINETFSLPGGPGFGRGRGGGPGGFRRGPGGESNEPPFRGPGPGFGGGGPAIDGVKLDPLSTAGDANKPLISKLLAVPALRARYLGYVREIATKWLDWETLGPMATRYQALISDAVKADTRKLTSFEAFEKGVTGAPESGGERGPNRSISLQQFAEQRRTYLLSKPEIVKAATE
jgi:hypothetical protein